MHTKGYTNLIRCFLFMGVMSFLSIGVLPTAAQDNFDAAAKEGSMNLAHKNLDPSVGIAPIDATAPAVFETASFGLG